MAGIDSYTKLMLHCDGTDGSTTFTDSSSGGKTVTAVGTAQIDTAQKVFGTASGLCDGDSDYLYTADHADFAFGSSPFTIDFRWRPASVAVTQSFFYQETDSTHALEFYWYVTGKQLVFLDYNGAYTVYFTCPFDPSVNTWYHIALVRVNTDNAATGWRIFTDGTSQELTLAGGAWNATITNYTGNVRIGANGGGTDLLNGWIDEYRVSNGIARWDSNFTPPTEAYSDSTFIPKVIIC